jgi:hypothetical protein
MAKPKRLDPLTGQPFRDDTSLIKLYRAGLLNETSIKKLNPDKIIKLKKASKEALDELWRKYEMLRFKMKGELLAKVAEYGWHMQPLLEEYDSRAFEKFMNSLNGVRLPDWEHLSNPSMWISLWGYWRSMNRDIIKEHLNWSMNTVSEMALTDKTKGSDKSAKQEGISNLDLHEAKGAVSNCEKDFEQKIMSEIFECALSELNTKLSPKQRKLFELKQKGMATPDVKKKLGITSKIYTDNLAFIRARLGEIIKDVSHRMKYDVTLKDYQ